MAATTTTTLSCCCRTRHTLTHTIANRQSKPTSEGDVKWAGSSDVCVRAREGYLEVRRKQRETMNGSSQSKGSIFTPLIYKYRVIAPYVNPAVQAAARALGFEGGGFNGMDRDATRFCWLVSLQSRALASSTRSGNTKSKKIWYSVFMWEVCLAASAAVC